MQKDNKEKKTDYFSRKSENYQFNERRKEEVIYLEGSEREKRKLYLALGLTEPDIVLARGSAI